VSTQDKVKINKLPTGVPGLDEIVGGGLPEGLLVETAEVRRAEAQARVGTGEVQDLRNLGEPVGRARVGRVEQDRKVVRLGELEQRAAFRAKG